MPALTKYPYVMVVPAKTVYALLFGPKFDITLNRGMYFLVDYIVRTHQEFMHAEDQKFKTQTDSDVVDPVVLLCRSHVVTALIEQGINFPDLPAMGDDHPITVPSANPAAWKFYQESLAKKV